MSFDMRACPPQLTDLAKEALRLYLEASAQNEDLWGYSVLDLVADNTDASLSDIKAAIVCSGIYSRANRRIRAQIAGYR